MQQVRGPVRQLFDDAWRAFIEGLLYADTDSPRRDDPAFAVIRVACFSMGAPPASSKRILPHMDVCGCPMRLSNVLQTEYVPGQADRTDASCRICRRISGFWVRLREGANSANTLTTGQFVYRQA